MKKWVGGGECAPRIDVIVKMPKKNLGVNKELNVLCQMQMLEAPSCNISQDIMIKNLFSKSKSAKGDNLEKIK